MTPLTRGTSNLAVAFVAIATILGASGRAPAALQKPAYVSGDHWTYVLESSLDGFPGLTGSEIGRFQFDLVGRVEVRIIGQASLFRDGATVETLRVDTRTTAYLNGTFSSLPGGRPGSAVVTGTYTGSASEFWDNRSFLPIEAHATSLLVADVTYLFARATLRIDLLLNATTTPEASAPFELDVGERATVDLSMVIAANTTVTFLGQTQSSTNETHFASTWTREVLAVEPVTVEAGTFAAHRLNQTLSGFSGLPAVGGGNETAHYSNDAGYYAKRVAYENGTPVSEMRLKSYSYAAGPRPTGLDSIGLLILFSVPAAAALVIALFIRKRQRDRVRRPSDVVSRPAREEEGGDGPAR